MEVLKAQNICKTYGKDGTLVKALEEVDLKIEEGEFIVIIGESGSGKSTLLHILGGVDTPTSGKVYLDGVDVYSLNDLEQSKLRRQKIGLIYQFYNLIPTLNAKENIVLPLKLEGKLVDQEYLQKLIKLLNLSDRMGHLPSELSGGEQQRVAIARALVSRPSIILADEPTGNLDSKNSLEIVKLLKKANEEFSQTIVMVTHDVNQAKYASRLIKIADGHIIEDRTVN